MHEQLAQANPHLLRQMLTTFINTLMSADAGGLSPLCRVAVAGQRPVTVDEALHCADRCCRPAQAARRAASITATPR